jgi:diguanylate cyclase (GGDEF)-like protein
VVLALYVALSSVLSWIDETPCRDQGDSMERVPSTVLHRCFGRIRDWPVWSLPRPLLAFVLAVICVDLAWIVARAVTFQIQANHVALFGALLACNALTVELTRRASESVGVAKDVYAVWELPVVILLPPLYGLVIPAIRLALTQWRVRQAPVYRRVFTAAAIGTAYGCGSTVFHTILPNDSHPREYFWSHTAIWLTAAVACAVTQWAVNQVLILTAVRSADPTSSVLRIFFGKEVLHNDATELSAAVLVALGLVTSPLTLIIALPLGTLLQRSFRHAQLLHEAREDAKTGLLNAATWEREAAAEIARAVRTGTPLAVALLDLDRFKQINDTYGHLAGDKVLRQIAGTMTEVLREYDLAGRFGGEEFVMLLPQTRAVDALRIAERVRAHIARLPIYGAGGAEAERISVTVSIGVAALDAGSRRELTELLAAADAALYRAKASGRDQVQMISTSRGLSAVRPPSGDSAGTPGSSAMFGGSLLSGAGPVLNGQPPEDGKASTATTSALAV